MTVACEAIWIAGSAVILNKSFLVIHGSPFQVPFHGVRFELARLNRKLCIQVVFPSHYLSGPSRHCLEASIALNRLLLLIPC